jgi:alpha/beta superfamily hydrolase
MGLPEPTLSFTIPSIHDDTTIDARIYHPADTLADPFGHEQNVKRGAIVAHPYAPLGGSQDDAVVGIVASQVLKEGFVVCTFNFRYEREFL